MPLFVIAFRGACWGSEGALKENGAAAGSPGWGGARRPRGSAGTTQVSDDLGPAELLGIFPGRGGRQLEAIRPREGERIRGLAKVFCWERELGRGAGFPRPVWKDETFLPGQLHMRMPRTQEARPLGLPWGCVRVGRGLLEPQQPQKPGGQAWSLCLNGPWCRPALRGGLRALPQGAEVSPG